MSLGEEKWVLLGRKGVFMRGKEFCERKLGFVGRKSFS